jgi:hypothetical protein
MANQPTQAEWVALGVQLGYCSEATCATHDGTPTTPEEDQA